MDKKLCALRKFTNSFGVGVRVGGLGITPGEIGYSPVGRRYKRTNIKGHISVGIVISQLIYGTIGNVRNVIAKTLTHELGHFLIAPPGRRYRHDYGITSETYVYRRGSRGRYKWDLDEAKAILVQHQLLRSFGFANRVKILKDPLSHYRSMNDIYRTLRNDARRWHKETGKAMIDKLIDDWRKTI